MFLQNRSHLPWTAASENQKRLSDTSGELNFVLSRFRALEKEDEQLMKNVERFITVVPLELPPHDVRLSPEGPYPAFSGPLSVGPGNNHFS